MNVMFTVIDEGSKAMAADGNHVIAIIKEPEDVKKLAKSLSEVGFEYFDIEWFSGGD